jgi:1-acyl-sn-glycerol-3-phosphate acyltransferase
MLLFLQSIFSTLDIRGICRLMTTKSAISPTMTTNPLDTRPPAHIKPVHPFYFYLLRLARRIGEWLFRPKVTGLEQLPREGPVLLLPNHISYGDAMLMQTASPRHVRFVVYEPIYHRVGLRWIMRLMRTIPIMPGNSENGLKATIEALEAGHVVCLFPEGGISRTGKLLALKRGFQRIAAATDAPVLPVHIAGLKASGLPRKHDEVTVKFRALLPSGQATVEVVTDALQPDA